jgi:1-deoxy-D-xylulose-5-phosphate reductoisomerase
VLNGANEAAVEAFLNAAAGTRAVGFADIARLTEAAMDAVGVRPLESLEDVLRADRAAREFVRGALE